MVRAAIVGVPHVTGITQSGPGPASGPVTVLRAGIDVPTHSDAARAAVAAIRALPAPVDVAVKPTVHVERAFAFVREPANVTDVGPVVFRATVCAIQGWEAPSAAVDVPVVPTLACSDGAATAAASDSFETGFAFEAVVKSFVVAVPPKVAPAIETPASLE